MQLTTQFCARALAALVLFSASACGGSQPKPENSPEPPTAETPNTEEPAPAAASAKGENDDEKWEGEGDATGGKAKEGTGAGDATAAGSRLEGIIKIVVKNRPAARKCYDDARKDLPTLQGDMTITFVVDPKGKMKSGKVNQEKSSLKSAAVADCIIAVLGSLEYPPSENGMETKVNYPYNFKPDGAH
jgi:hypothetical protein